MKSRNKTLKYYDSKIFDIFPKDNIKKLTNINRSLKIKDTLNIDIKNKKELRDRINGIKYINKGLNMLNKKRCKYV